LEAAIAIFDQTKPNPEYEVSEYATGNKRWRCSPAQHPVPIQDLLLYDVQARQEKNKILGEKVAKVVSQHIHLAQQASRTYEMPSERLKKDPIMGLVTRTVATYMFLKHNNDQKLNNKMEKNNFSSWGLTFFKKKEWEQEKNQKSESQKKKERKQKKVTNEVRTKVNQRDKKREKNQKSESQKKKERKQKKVTSEGRTKVNQRDKNPPAREDQFSFSFSFFILISIFICIFNLPMVIFQFPLEISRIAKPFPTTPSLTFGESKNTKTPQFLGSTRSAETSERQSLQPVKND
jgi:hypothetical protein